MTEKIFKDITVSDDEFKILKLIRDYQYSLECEMDNLDPSNYLMKITQYHNGIEKLLSFIYSKLKEERKYYDK